MSEMTRIDQAVGAPSIIPGVSQTISIGATSQQSTALQIENVLGRATTWVRLYATTPCFVTMGVNPTATSASGMFLDSGLTDCFGVPPGATHLAVIQQSASGTLYMTEAL